jgi:hypothetical protein
MHMRICELWHKNIIWNTWISDIILIISDTILKKYSSTVATIFTGIASAALFGHTLTINFMLGISIVFISMHQVIYKEIVKEILWIIWKFFFSP